MASRFAQRDAGYRASDATKFKGPFLVTEGRLYLDSGVVAVISLCPALHRRPRLAENQVKPVRWVILSGLWYKAAS